MQKDILEKDILRGCEVVDVVEQIAIDRAKNYLALLANVQPHSVHKYLQFIMLV
jgi:glycine/serine hydroxymethyltransferase